MSKHLKLSVFLLLTAFVCIAQPDSEDYAAGSAKQEILPKNFMNIAGGINANFGMVGLGAELGIHEKFSFELGGGLSGWGLKGHGEIKYYLKEDYEGFAFGFGAGRSSGVTEFLFDMETEPDNEVETVELLLKPVTTINISVTRAWRLGHSRKHRFYLQTGYVARTTEDIYSVKSDHLLSPGAVSTLKTVAPGGITLGLGFSVGL